MQLQEYSGNSRVKLKKKKHDDLTILDLQLSE